jgi:glycine/D-amino acid oxidase-like deaminating enzyme/nitrite reductase/ring-hydroxylating ferredoxin subunit
MATLDTSSLWLESGPLPTFAPLDRDSKVDVVVVGGGITGITTAYLMKQAGMTVALLERGRCAGVDTGHTTAHLTAVTDLRLHELIRNFDTQVARAVWDAGGAAIDEIVKLIREAGIRCGFRWVPGYLHAPLVDEAVDALAELDHEIDAARQLEIPVSQIGEVPYCRRPGVKFAQQALFHPRQYLAGLLKRIPGGGCHVYEETAATEVTEQPLAVKVGNHTIQCGYVVLATHNPLIGHTRLMKALLFQTKLSLYTSYALAAKVPTGRLPEALFWDTGDPYYYLRVERATGHDLAIFGGEDHKTGQETDTVSLYQRLEKRLKQFVPEAKVTHRWSGQVIETHDGLPYIGETAERQFAATGFSGNGMTFGTLAAMMSVDAMLKRKNPWQDLFDVHRKKLAGATWDYVKENADYPYYMLRDRLTHGARMEPEELGRNQGRILSRDGRKLAAYRDEHGKVTVCSPVCPHLGCIVGWNEAEKTWDCPCHGSRFKPTGEVIAGPAEDPLEKIALADFE